MRRDDIRNSLDPGLQAVGMRRRGFEWRLEGDEVMWIVYLDRLPHGDRVGIDVGCEPIGQGPPARRASDCPIVMHAENIALPKDLDVTRLLDLSSSDAEADRAAGVTLLGDALATYITGRQTLRELQKAFAAGEFQSAFLSNEARELLKTRS
jgi:hypothetical protein